MNELTPDQAEALGAVTLVVASAFLILGAAVILARAVKPAVDRLSAVNLEAMGLTFRDGLRDAYERPRVIDIDRSST